MTRFAFDRVEVKEDDGSIRELSPQAFVNLRLDLRIRYILGKRLRFLRGAEEVPLRDALSSLQ